MKSITRFFLLNFFAFLLLGCDGGEDKAPSNYRDITWKPPSKEECELLLSENLFVNDVKLGSSQEIDIQSALETASPNGANQIFLKNIENFMSWVIDEETTLATAVHESSHGVDRKLHHCSEDQLTNYFYQGKFFKTSFFNSETVNYSIVEETLPIHLRNTFAYFLYIEQSKNVNGNKFDTLLSEFVAYITENKFVLDYIEIGLDRVHPNYTAFNNVQLSQLVNIMLYIEYYLKSARLYYPDTYEAISRSDTINVIQFFWSEAEKITSRSYSHLMEDKLKNGHSTFFDGSDDYLSGLDILKAVYSPEALAELDMINIDHKDYSEWKFSYFSND